MLCPAFTAETGHVWTAPAVQEESDLICEAFGCSHVCGLFVA